MKKICIIDEKANQTIITSIEALGFQVIKVPAHPNLFGACASHPDISFCRVAPNTLVYAKKCNNKLIQQLKACGLHMIPGETELNDRYPFDVAYNGVRIGQYFFHNMRITDPQVVKQCEEQELCRIHVKQGYTCCATAVIRENLVITADVGIAEALKQVGTIKVLQIPPQKEIQLPGLDYGFIGGATGRIDDTHFAMAGHIKYLENGKEIQEFLQENGVQLICLTDEKPVDLGTMLFFTLSF